MRLLLCLDHSLRHDLRFIVATTRQRASSTATAAAARLCWRAPMVGLPASIVRALCCCWYWCASLAVRVVSRREVCNLSGLNFAAPPRRRHPFSKTLFIPFVSFPSSFGSADSIGMRGHTHARASTAMEPSLETGCVFGLSLSPGVRTGVDPRAFIVRAPNLR